MERLQKLQDAGHDIAALDNRPHLTLWTKDLYAAFNLLTDSRAVHFGGLGSIPLSEIEAYMRIDGIENIDDRYRFMKIIKRMDETYLNLCAKRREQKERQDAQSSNSRQVGRSNLPPRGRLKRG